MSKIQVSLSIIIFDDTCLAYIKVLCQVALYFRVAATEPKMTTNARKTTS